ncbi:hypothetical protein [Lentzea sp. NPDC055074]
MTSPLRALEETANWYRDQMAWPVVVTGDEVVLPLGRGVVALDVPSDLAGKVRTRLERLHGNDFCTPVLLLTAGEQARAVFLAAADDVVLGQFQMPHGVRYLGAETALVLPARGMTAGRHWPWLRAPDPGDRWLFSAAAVLAAVKDSAPRQYRSSVDSTSRSPASRRLLIG